MKRSHALLALVALLFVWNTWSYDLWAPDEPFFGEGAKEMVVDGHWAVPHVNGEINTHKPPLFFWLIALFSLPLGQVTSLTARLPSVLAAVGSVWLILRLGRRMGGESLALHAGLIVSSSFLFWRQARSAQIDSLLCLLILVALSAFEAHREGTASGRNAGLLFWAAAALATLAKGPVGFLLPLGVVLATLAFDRNLRAWKRFAPWSGPLLFLAIVAAWIAAATIGTQGQYSVVGALREHFVDRAMHGMHHAQPFWYYSETLPLMLLPWAGFLPGALWLAWKRRFSSPDRFLLVWALFVVVFFSVSTEKRDLYVLPAFPALALLLARFAGALDGEEPAPLSRRWATIPSYLLALTLVGLGSVLIWASLTREELPVPASLVVSALTVLTGAAAGYAAFRGGVGRWIRVTAVGISLVFLALVTGVYPALNGVKSTRAFAMTIQRVIERSGLESREVPHLALGSVPAGFDFYSDGVQFPRLRDVAELVSHLQQTRRVYALARERDIAQIPPELRQRLVVVASTSRGGRAIKLLHNGAPAD